MLSLDLYNAIERLLEASNEYEPLVAAIKTISDHYESASEAIVGHAEGGEKLTQSASALQNRFVNLHAAMRGMSPSKVYRSIDAFKAAVNREFDSSAIEHPWVSSAIYGVDSFASLYDEYLTRQSPNNAAKMMIAARDLNILLGNFFTALAFYRDTVEQANHLEPNASMSLVLAAGSELSAFIGKLAALQALYSEICLLANVSEAQNPLQIIKIESGSLWAKVFGEPRIIASITSLIEATIGYLHRSFTTEGKIASVPRRLEALEATIQISKKLEEAGIDTDEMKEHLRKSGVVIAKSLSSLLEDQPKIRLNGKSITVGATLETILVAQHKTLQITHEDERIEPKLEESPPDEDEGTRSN